MTTCRHCGKDFYTCPNCGLVGHEWEYCRETCWRASKERQDMKDILQYILYSGDTRIILFVTDLITSCDPIVTADTETVFREVLSECWGNGVVTAKARMEENDS